MNNLSNLQDDRNLAFLGSMFCADALFFRAQMLQSICELLLLTLFFVDHLLTHIRKRGLVQLFLVLLLLLNSSKVFLQLRLIASHVSLGRLTSEGQILFFQRRFCILQVAPVPV